jgi:hypothetical protein
MSTRWRVGSKLDVAPDVSKSSSREVNCFGVGYWLSVVLEEFFSISEEIQIGEVETVSRW